MSHPHRPLGALLAATLGLAGLLGGCAPATAPSLDPASASPASTSAIACTPAETPASPPWGDRAWYEVFVRSFADSDGDGIGDLRGLTERLDYLNDGDPATTDDLGVGGLWLMPIAEATSYHGYDVTDYRAVDPDYGTLDDLRALLAAAHERGMRVIVDFVPNHTSSRHPWFRDALRGGPHADWYVLADENPGWAGPDGRTAWHEAAGRWYYGVFDASMPDLDLTNPAVTAELEDVARYWLADVGVDGFRIDAAKHLVETAPDAQTNTPGTHAWLAGFRATAEAAQPDVLLVGEVWDIAAIAGRYVPDDLDLTFDFGFAQGVRLALTNGRAGPLRTALSDSLRWWPANRNATFLGNHDQDRIMSALGGDPAAARLAAFLLLSGPGTPFLYYGEEIGLTGAKPDERIRTPMPWTDVAPGAGFTSGTPWEPLADAPAGTSVAAQVDDPGSLLSTYRTLLRARDAEATLHAGGTLPLETGSESVAAWLRTTASGTALVVANLSAVPVRDYALELGEGPFCGALVTRLVTSVGWPPLVDGAPAPPAVGERGGFAGYRPVPELPARSGLVIALVPGR